MIRLARSEAGARSRLRRRRRRETDPPESSPVESLPEDTPETPEPENSLATGPSPPHAFPGSGARLTLSVGVAHKRGLPSFGSIGASCGLELELDAQLLSEAPEQFRARVRDAYDACARAVQDELDRRRTPHPPERDSTADDHPRPEPPGPPATPAQIRALHAISRRLDLDLDDLVLKRFQVAHPEALSRAQASRLIGALQPHGSSDDTP